MRRAANASTNKPQDSSESKALTIREASGKIQRELELRRQELVKVLPPGMNVERFIRVSLLATSKNATLLTCSPGSIIRSIIEAAEVGLEPTGKVGGAWLVPFRNKQGVLEAQLIYDYRGTQELIRNGGGGEVKAVLVYEGDEFRVIEGTQPRIEHIPHYETRDPSKITFVYAFPLDHPEKFEVLTKGDIDGVRARSKAANNGPWVTDYGQMARKTAINRLANYLSLRPEARERLEIDTEREYGDGMQPAASHRSRTDEVRDRIRQAVGAADPLPPTEDSSPEAPGSSEKPKVDNDATAEPNADAGPVVEGKAREICGAESDPKLGDVVACNLTPHPEGPHKLVDYATGEVQATWPR